MEGFRFVLLLLLLNAQLISNAQIQQRIKSSGPKQIMYGMVSFPSARTLIKMVNPIYMCLDDFWFYGYHNRTFSPLVANTLQAVQEINSIRLMPTMFDAATYTMKQKITFTYMPTTDFANQTPSEFLLNEKIGVSFLKNTQNLIIYGYFYSIMMYILIRIVCSTRLRKVKIIGQYLKEKKQIGFLLVALIQNNAQYLCFMAFQQIQIPFQYNIYDRINLIAAVLFLFVVFMYSIGHFFVVFYCRRKQWSIYLHNMDEKSSSFYYSSFFLTLRGVLTGFAHSFLIYQPKIQSYMILTLDLLSFLTIIWFWKASLSSVSNVLLCSYLFFKMCIDAFILLDLAILYNIEYAEYYLIIGLVVSLFFIFSWEVIIVLREFLASKAEGEEEKFDQPKIKKTKPRVIPDEISVNMESIELSIDQQKHEAGFFKLFEGNGESELLEFRSMRKRQRTEGVNKRIFKVDMRTPNTKTIRY